MCSQLLLGIKCSVRLANPRSSECINATGAEHIFCCSTSDNKTCKLLQRTHMNQATSHINNAESCMGPANLISMFKSHLISSSNGAFIHLCYENGLQLPKKLSDCAKVMQSFTSFFGI
jgi:hypothetical protein